MIYQKMEVTLEVEWLDPEGSDKARRRLMVEERLLKLFGHEFAAMTVEKHGVKIEIVKIDGRRVKPSREVEEPTHVQKAP